VIADLFFGGGVPMYHKIFKRKLANECLPSDKFNAYLWFTDCCDKQKEVKKAI
jgi:hypothetical protein